MNALIHPRRWSVVLVAASCLQPTARCHAQAVEKPIWQGDYLPTPPAQKEAWTPPDSNLTKALIDAATILFHLGLADPRGCEYRSIRLDRRQDKSIHGWLLPPEKAGAQRFAVCWNGLVYPISSVAEKADVKADVIAAIKAGEESDESDLLLRFLSPRYATDESLVLSHETVVPLKAALLLRLGEGELASRVWFEWCRKLGERDPEYRNNPFVTLAESWTWCAFDRALQAHMRGDDPLALAAARDLVSMQTEVHEAAVTLGVQRYTKERVRERLNKDGSREFQSFQGDVERPVYLNAPSALTLLLADQMRRARNRQQPRALSDEHDKKARIRALVADLENVAVLQNSNPGYPNLSATSVVQKLIKEGDDAVEPLLDVLEHDDRLTRSVSYWRDFSKGRNIIGVHEPAYVALCGILRTHSFDSVGAENSSPRNRTAAAVRGYWTRFKGMPPEWRRFTILADDKASPNQWLEAASAIAEPETEVDGKRVGGKARMRGESLWAKQSPTVSELIARRVAQMTKLDPAANVSLDQITKLALCLARWNPEGARPTLKWLVIHAQAQCAAETSAGGDPFLHSFFSGYGPGRSLATLTIAQVRCGDAKSLEEYSAWMRTMSITELASSIPMIFEPMWTYPRHPAITELGEWLFNDARSPWPFLLRSANRANLAIVRSPLLGVRAFRKQIQSLLRNKSKLGTITVSAPVVVPPGRRFPGAMNGHFSMEISKRTQTGDFDESDPLAIPGVPLTLRICDYVGWELSDVAGLPEFQPYWPEKNRDDVLRAVSSFLDQFGDRFARPDGTPEMTQLLDSGTAALIFPDVGHPATPEDVKNGLAIFSLGVDARARVQTLASRPLFATWKRADRSGTKETFGLVWQAEVTQEQGAPRVYYGFVGHHTFAKVPAEQIEFLPTDNN
jgi:hypothetical protein